MTTYLISTNSDYPKIQTLEVWQQEELESFWALFQGSSTKRPKDAWDRYVKILGLVEIPEQEIPKNNKGELILSTFHIKGRRDYNLLIQLDVSSATAGTGYVPSTMRGL